MKSIKDEKNSVLPRREIVLESSHASKPTPNNSEVMEEVSKLLKCKKDLIIIKKIDTKFGSNIAKIKAHIYDNIEDMKIIERIKEKPKSEENKEQESKSKEELKEKSSEEKIESK